MRIRLKKIIINTNRILDLVIRREAPKWWLIVEFFIIKYLYILLVIMVLNNLWYEGYGSYGVEFSILKETVASIVFFVVTYIYLSINITKTFVNITMRFLYVLYYIPLNSSFAINNLTWDYFVLSNLYFTLVLIFVALLGKVVETNKFLRHQMALNEKKVYNDKNTLYFCLIVAFIFIAHKVSYNGLDLSFTIASEEVYSNRATYQDYLNSISGSFFSYMLSIVRNLISYVMPFLVLASLLKGKKGYFLVGVACALAIYAVSSDKGKLFMLFVAIAIFFCEKIRLLKHFDRLFNVGVIILLIGCVIMHITLGIDTVYMLIVRRVMYLPAWLNSLYYDFFSQNSKVLWTQNVFLLQNIFSPVHDLSPLELISNAYFQNTIPSPNTGMFAEAYMHFGVIGVLFYPMIISILLWISEVAYGKHCNAIKCVTAVQLILSMTNVPITRTDFVLSYILFSGIVWMLTVIDFKRVSHVVYNVVKQK